MPSQGVLDDPLEGGVIAGVFKKNRAFGGPIEYMKQHPRCLLSTRPRHSPERNATSMPVRPSATVLEK